MPFIIDSHRRALTSFVPMLLSVITEFRLTSADFTELLTTNVSIYVASRSIRGDVSRRYSIIPSLELSVLLLFKSATSLFI